MRTKHLIPADLKYENGTDLYRLSVDCEKEVANGSINFKSPFYKKACKIIGLKYSLLSALGKMRLRADGIETVTKSFSGDDSFHDIDYYMS